MPCTTYTAPVCSAVASGAVTRVVAAAASSPPRAMVKRRMVHPSGSDCPFDVYYRPEGGFRCTRFEQFQYDLADPHAYHLVRAITDDGRAPLSRSSQAGRHEDSINSGSGVRACR